MLQLKNISKNYYVGSSTVEALKGVCINFRKNEFVSVLGPSGCGKTTLLNIVGGLDKYTAGDILIDNISTTLYSDGDWDSYRNHRIGFVFQSYNLIPHQTVIENVELALTLSGIKSAERKKRAVSALERVGLADQLNKLPSQLSGGQMQRVAIARAIVNDPEIILADEPTGALDTETSIQVIDILKELSKERLIVMVTHNSELAEKYSSRIIRLKDGEVISDSDPFVPQTDGTAAEEKDDSRKPGGKEHKKRRVKKEKPKERKPSMSFLTALSLSFKNLKTKLTRTVLTSFAGSIGIIGIALILSLSSGFSDYISDVQRNTLSNYPVELNKNTMSMQGLMTTYMGSAAPGDLQSYPGKKDRNGNKVIPDRMIQSMIEAIGSTYGTNDLGSFRKYLEEKREENLLDSSKISAISYRYNLDMNIYRKDSAKKYKKVNEILPLESYLSEKLPVRQKVIKGMTPAYEQFKMMIEKNGAWKELLDDGNRLIKSQYDVLAGDFPSQGGEEEHKNGEPWDIVVVVDKYNRIPDFVLYLMGIVSDKDVKYVFSRMAFDVMSKLAPGGSEDDSEEAADKRFEEFFKDEFKGYKLYGEDITFDSLINSEYEILLNGEYYKHVATVYENPAMPLFSPINNIYEKQDETTDRKFIEEKLKQAEKIRISGILRLKEDVTGGALMPGVYYTPAFTRHLIAKTQSLDVIKDQMKYDSEATDEKDVFNAVRGTDKDGKVLGGKKPGKSVAEQNFLVKCRRDIGMVDESEPTGIAIYPTSFENKDYVISLIDGYNKDLEKEGKKSKTIQYTDYIGMMMSSVTTIIDAITYVLIAFVSISLVVSSIMIGVITYISVLERTKEIGILRAIGASKKDISRVFNAETTIIGFTAGLIGILLTMLLNIPINLIISHLAGISGVAALPADGAVTLVAISIVLTLIAGLIPSKMASEKDPVIALRTD